MSAPVAIVLAVAGLVYVIAYLVFGAWLVRRTDDVTSLREAARYIAKIPFPRITGRIPRK
jgi:hypothetical protein